jgi:hypothetical protein
MSFRLYSLPSFSFHDCSQIQRLQASISSILDEKEKTNDTLVIAVFNLLMSAARYQVLFLLCSFFEYAA